MRCWGLGVRDRAVAAVVEDGDVVSGLPEPLSLGRIETRKPGLRPLRARCAR